MGATGTGVAHCPTSNGRLGAGIAPVPALLAAGPPVGLGVDGAASNECGELVDEIRAALVLARVAHGPAALTARDALEMATRHGARCLGREDELGHLSAGALADVALWELDEPGFAGIADPVFALAFGPTRPVHTLLVGGHAVVAGRRAADRRSGDARRRPRGASARGWRPHEAPAACAALVHARHAGNHYASRLPEFGDAPVVKLVTPRLAPSRIGEYLIALPAGRRHDAAGRPRVRDVHLRARGRRDAVGRELPLGAGALGVPARDGGVDCRGRRHGRAAPRRQAPLRADARPRRPGRAPRPPRGRPVRGHARARLPPPRAPPRRRPGVRLRDVAARRSTPASGSPSPRSTTRSTAST